MLCSCVTAGTLLLNNYWADGQHKVPGIKCSHTCNLQKEERINQIRQEVFDIYEILCKDLASQSVSLTHSLSGAGPRFRSVLFDSLPNIQ